MKLLGKNKTAILSLFITHPSTELYMHEIGRALEKKPGVFQKALNALVADGVLLDEYRANARYFHLNTQHPLLNELKAIVKSTAGVSTRIQKALKDIKRIEFAFVYGSYAQNRERGASDIDLMLIGSPNEGTVIKKLDVLEERVCREINFSLYSLKEFIKELRKKNAFLKSVLDSKKIMIIGDEHELRKICTK